MESKIYIYIYIYIFTLTVSSGGSRGCVVGWGTALQAGRSRFQFPVVLLEFFIDTNLPAALWPWSDSVSIGNEYQEYFLG